MTKEALSPDEIARTIDSYLRDCFERESPPRVDELAQTVGLASAALSRRFRRCCGVRLADHLKRQQVEFAERLLRDSDLTTTQIAYRAGFGTRRTFFRSYRRLTGDTPDAYRSRLRAGAPASADVEAPIRNESDDCPKEPPQLRSDPPPHRHVAPHEDPRRRRTSVVDDRELVASRGHRR
jgi:AraC-like DNA-binding protein